MYNASIRDLEKKMTKHGWKLLRHGSNHDVWTNGIIVEPLPRHNEINERLAKKILKTVMLNPGIKG